MNKDERTGLMTLFNATPGGVHNSFWTSINGRLFYKKAPSGTSLLDGPYAIFQVVSDNSDDTFSEKNRDAIIQFSIFSGEATDGDFDDKLDTMLNGVSFTITGKSLTATREHCIGPITVSETTEKGTEEYSQTDIDYMFRIQGTF